MADLIFPTGIVTFAVALVATPVVARVLLRLKVLDQPNHRSLHTEPIPRGGGIAVAVGCVAGVLASYNSKPWLILVPAVAFAGLGLADDLAPRSPVFRLVAQLALSIGAVTAITVAQGWPSGRWFLVPLSLLWIVSFVNAFNFMDGINGISATQAVLAGGYWWLVGAEYGQPTLANGGLIVAAASAGFAPFNVMRGKVFLGDVGSYFIGSWLAILAVVGVTAGVPPVMGFAPFVIYLADTSTTILRRVLRGENWHKAHRDHTYQRLVALGWSHGQVTMFTGALIIVSCLIALFRPAAQSVASQLTVGALLLGVCVVYLAMPQFAAQPALRRLVGRQDRW